MKLFLKILSIILDITLMLSSLMNIFTSNGSWFDYYIVIGNCVLVLPATLLGRNKERQKHTEHTEEEKQ